MYLHIAEGDVIQAGQIVLGSILVHERVWPYTVLGVIADGSPAPSHKAVAGAGNRDGVSSVAEAPKGAEFYRLRHDQGSAAAAPVSSVIDVPIGINAVKANAVVIPVFDVAGPAAHIRIQVGTKGVVAATAASLGPEPDIDSGDGGDENGKQVSRFHFDEEVGIFLLETKRDQMNIDKRERGSFIYS